jgi:hypothetical protein
MRSTSCGLGCIQTPQSVQELDPVEFATFCKYHFMWSTSVYPDACRNFNLLHVCSIMYVIIRTQNSIAWVEPAMHVSRSLTTFLLHTEGAGRESTRYLLCMPLSSANGLLTKSSLLIVLCAGRGMAERLIVMGPSTQIGQIASLTTMQTFRDSMQSFYWITATCGMTTTTSCIKNLFASEETCLDVVTTIVTSYGRVLFCVM